MAKQGMNRPEWTHPHPKNDEPPVPEIQGKSKHGKAHVNPIVADTSGPSQNVWHNKGYSEEKPISSAYKGIDNDLARDNLENDIPAADLQIYNIKRHLEQFKWRFCSGGDLWDQFGKQT